VKFGRVEIEIRYRTDRQTDRQTDTLSAILRTLTGAELNNKSSAVAEMGDRLATIGMGRKWGGAAVGGWVPTGSPSNTMWPGLRPTTLPSGKLDQCRVHVTKFRQNRLTLKGRSSGQRHTDRHTETDRQTRLKIKALQVCAIGPTDRQRTDGIGRTVLQTLAQKSL